MTVSILGTSISHYRVLEEIGKGGMGEVYVGYDEKLERRVALKTILTEHRLNPESKARFLREARILSKLAHPGICQIFDLVEQEDLDILVLELIQGDSLKVYLKPSKDLAPRLVLARELADVLVAAHAAGIIHRDLKPDNVMVTREGHVKVLDFGLARSIEPENTVFLPRALGGLHPRGEESGISREDTKTELGSVMGTLQYMSPEQARGESLTPASDIYSLGLIYQELFTGRPAQIHQDGSTFQERLERVKQGESNPVEGLDADFSALLRRMKSPDPHLRPTAVDVAVRVRELEARPAQRRRRILLLSAVAILALSTLGTALLAIRAAREKARAESVSRFLTGMFEAARPANVLGRNLSAVDVVDLGAQKLAMDLERQPENRAALLHTLGSVYRVLDQFDKAGPLLEKALLLREQTLGTDQVETLSTRWQLGAVQLAQGDKITGERNLQRAYEGLKRRVGAAHPETVSAHASLGYCYQLEGRFPEAERCYRECLKDLERSVPPQEEALVIVTGNLAVLLAQQERAGEAISMLQAILARTREQVPGEHPSVLRLLSQLGYAQAQAGDFKGAEATDREALALHRHVSGARSVNVASDLVNLGFVLEMQNRLKEAESCLMEGVSILREKLGKGHPFLGYALENLADCLVRMDGRGSEALAAAQEALRIFQESNPPGSDARIRALVTLAYAFLACDRTRDAEAQILTADREATEQTGSLVVRRSALVMGIQFYRDSGHAAKAETWERRLADLPAK